MNKKYTVFILATIFFCGCATQNYRKPPYNAPSDDASIKLAEAANAVSDSMLQMARTEKVLTPPHRDNTMTIPSSTTLQTHASVDWSGPIAEVTERVAKAAHYQVRVLGRAPSIPILVSLNMQDKSLAEILRNIDYQAGQKAFIHVYPNSQVVELRYANHYS